MGSLMMLRRRMLLASRQMRTISGSIVSFTSASETKLSRMQVAFTPIQAGSGDPSPTNIRTISGRTGLTVRHCKKNLISATPEEIKACGASAAWTWNGNHGTRGDATVEIQTDADGNVTGLLGSNTAASGSQSIDVPLNTTLAGSSVTITGCPAGGSSVGYRLLVQDFSSSAHVHARQYGSPVDFTFPEATDVRARVIFQSGYSDILFQPMLTLEGVDQTYEPYAGADYPVSFGGTLYGGYVDLVRGELVQTYGLISSYAGDTLPGRWISDRDVYVPGATPTIGAQVCYEFATPVTTPLTPQEIRAYIGVNTIWSDDGITTVKYIK